MLGGRQMRFHAMCYSCASLIVLALGTSSAERQQPSVGQDQQPKPEITNAAKKAVLKEGTEVHLKLAQTMTSKTSSVGEPVEMVLAEDLTVGQDIVALKGARVLGTVV